MADLTYTDALTIRRAQLCDEIDERIARIAEIDHWLDFAGIDNRGKAVVVEARNPRKIKREQQKNNKA